MLTEPGPSQRGLTLIEVVVAAALVATALVATLSIVLQFNDAAASELARTQISRDVSVLDSLLAHDVASARPCEPSRVGTHWTVIEPDRLAWTIDVEGDGNLQQVTWQASGGQLTRVVTPMQGRCGFEGGSATVLLAGITGAGPENAAIHAVMDRDRIEAGGCGGVASAGPIDCIPPGTCGSTSGASHPSDCQALTSVELSARAVSRDGTIVPITRRLSFPDDRARVRP